MKYLKNEHFNEVLSLDNLDKDKLFHHQERLSSKAMLFSSGDNLAIVYIDTIVFLKVGKTVTLNTDGWQTLTSKKWINEGLSLAGINAYMHRENWTWYISQDGTKKEYQDGMIIKK